MRQRALRLTGALLMVALLVAPLAASAHTHRDLGTSRSCATCLATHHSQAITTPAAGTVAAVLAADPAPPPSCAVPANLYRSPRAGRAPPAPAPISAT